MCTIVVKEKPLHSHKNERKNYNLCGVCEMCIAGIHSRWIHSTATIIVYFSWNSQFLCFRYMCAFSSFSLHLVRFFISTDCCNIFRSSWRHCLFCVLHDFQYYNKTSSKFLTNKENSPSFQLVVLCKSFEYLFIWIFVP